MPTMQLYLPPLLLLLLLLRTTTTMTSSSSLLSQRPHGEPSDCALSLVALSPCLSYIAGPPNRPTSAPSLICCGTFYQAIMNAGPACVCYLLRDPLILGFPIDTGRLVAMFPSCRVNTTTSAVHWLYDTCQVSANEALAPLPSIAPALAAAAPVNSSSGNHSTEGHPSPAKSVAPDQVERHGYWGSLMMIWLILTINLRI